MTKQRAYIKCNAEHVGQKQVRNMKNVLTHFNSCLLRKFPGDWFLIKREQNIENYASATYDAINGE